MDDEPNEVEEELSGKLGLSLAKAIVELACDLPWFIHIIRDSHENQREVPEADREFMEQDLFMVIDAAHYLAKFLLKEKP